MKWILLSLTSLFFLLSCDRGRRVAITQKSNEWIYDSTQAKIIEGTNYVLIANKTTSKKAITGEVFPEEALEMIKEHDTATQDLKGQRSFYIEFDLEEFMTYTSNVGDLSKLAKFRVYAGVYPPGHLDTEGKPNEGRFSAILVAVGEDGLEKYSDNVAGMKLLNIGTLCPTNCPKIDDPRALHNLAKLPREE